MKGSFILLEILHFLVFLLPSLSSTIPVFNGFQVFDLKSSAQASLELEADSWTAVGFSSPSLVQNCIGDYFIGGPIIGYLTTFQRTYTDLPTHDSIRFVIRFFLIDSPSPTDTIKIDFQTEEVQVLGLDLAVAGGTQFCFTALNDFGFVSSVGYVGHSSSSLALSIVSLFTSAFAGFGVREVSLLFANAPTTPVTASYCTRRDFPATDFNACECFPYEYQNPDPPYDCLFCDGACEECFGPTASECISCLSGYSFTGTECVQCDLSCGMCSGTGPDECITCQPGLWLQRDGTCTASCDDPLSSQLEVDDFKLCQTDCDADIYKQDNGDCTGSCLPPLIEQTIQGNLFCENPCQPPNNVIQLDNTCGSSCTPPLVTRSVNGADRCQLPCNTNQYLYSNNQCLPQCDSPFSSETDSFGIRRCVSPCTSDTDFYYPSEKTCKSTCPGTTTTVNTLKTCTVSALSDDDRKSVETSKNIIESTGKAVGIGIMIMSLTSSLNPQILTLSSLAKMLEYIRYINIDYPPKVKEMLELRNTSSMSFDFVSTAPDSLAEKFESFPVPFTFEKYDTPSSFIINAWEAIVTLGFTLVVIILSEIITALAKKPSRIFSFWNRVKHIFKWDFFLLMFSSNVDGMGVFVSLQFRNLHRSAHLTAILDILVSFTVVSVFAYIIGKLLYIGIDLRRERLRIFSEPDSFRSIPQPRRKWKNWEILFAAFKDDSFFKQSFFFFFLLRLIIFDIAIGFFFDYPMLQACMITVLSILIISFLLKQRPYNELTELLQLISQEAIVFMVNICVLSLATMDKNGSEDPENRWRLGEVILVCNVLFNVLAFIFFVAETIKRTFKVYKLFRSTKLRGASFWRRLIFIFSEKSGMELEEKPIEDVDSPKAKPIHPHKAKLYINTNIVRKPFHLETVRIPDSPSDINDTIETPSKISSSHFTMSPSLKSAETFTSPTNEYLTRKQSRFISHNLTSSASKSKMNVTSEENIYEISLDDKSAQNISALGLKGRRKLVPRKNTMNLSQDNKDNKGHTPDQSEILTLPPSENTVEQALLKSKTSLRKTVLAQRLKRVMQKSATYDVGSNNSVDQGTLIEIDLKEKEDEATRRESEREEKKVEKKAEKKEEKIEEKKEEKKVLEKEQKKDQPNQEKK